MEKLVGVPNLRTPEVVAQLERNMPQLQYTRAKFWGRKVKLGPGICEQLWSAAGVFLDRGLVGRNFLHVG